MQGLARAESGLSGVLGRFFALSEAYPDLKSNENMMQLSEELSTTENKIAFARQAYNDAVMRYNNKCEMVPSNVVASTFGFERAEFFEVEVEAEPRARQSSVLSHGFLRGAGPRAQTH